MEEKTEKNKNSFFKSKVFLTIVSFVLGALVMFVIILLTTKTNILVQKVTSENVKTTTLEEISDLKNAINNVYDSAVYIEVTGDIASSGGSGFVYKKDKNNAYILTNYHVIKNGNKYTVTFNNGKEESATLVGEDEYYDIAVLVVSNSDDIKVATLGDSTRLELGDTLFTVGAPLGKDYMGTITKGIVSGTGRMIEVKLTTGTYLMEVIQTDASINNGNSGGPLLNTKRQVIGMMFLKDNSVDDVSFAIPINYILQTLDKLENRPNIGAVMASTSNTKILDKYEIEYSDISGVVIIEIVQGGLLDKYRLKKGDIIVSFNGKSINNIKELTNELYECSKGDTAKIRYYRNHEFYEINIQL